MPCHVNATLMGPPEQNTAGTLVRMAAKIIPGVILSQLEYRKHHQTSGH